MKRACLATVAALLVPGALAQEPVVRRAGVETEFSHLDNGSPAWESLTLRLSRQWDKRKFAEAALTRTRRFGQEDTQAAGTLAWPVTPALVATVTGHVSPTHRVLPKHGLGLSGQWEFRKAWLLHGGFKHARYDTTTVDTASVMLEHYFGNWSVLGAVHAAQAVGQRTHAGELRATYYYGDASSVGLILSSGDEATQLGPASVAVTPVRALALVGRHDLDGPWSLNWSAHHVRQGGFYTRSGGHVGVQYDF